LKGCRPCRSRLAFFPARTPEGTSQHVSVIDYTKEDFTQGEPRYDLILDNVASHSFVEYRRVLKPVGTLMPSSGHAGMGYIFKAFLLSLFVRQQGRPFVSTPNQDDLSAGPNVSAERDR
jgi:NADPH:quinone reductase-like Zn-dependent oxidoreductase